MAVNSIRPPKIPAPYQLTGQFGRLRYYGISQMLADVERQLRSGRCSMKTRNCVLNKHAIAK